VRATPHSVAITTGDWARLRQALLTQDGNENAAVLLCGAADIDSRRRLLARRILEVPHDRYIAREPYHLEVSPAFYNQVIDRCLVERVHPVIVHSHPHSDDAWYSKSDDYGESRLLPVLQSLVPWGTPASLVITPKTATARRFDNGRFRTLDSLAVVGVQSRLIAFQDGVTKDAHGDREQFDRQERAFGAEGQAVLQRLKVGIVGVGGTGSLVAEQLARAGVRDLLLIDPDRVEASNLSRLFGASMIDVGKPKVEVIGRHVRSFGAERVGCVAESAIRQAVLLRLRDRDVVFGCVDNDRSRAILNRFAHQYLVPVVDVGIRLDARNGAMRAAAGRVSVVGSGMVCLRCSHHLNAERIRAESLPSSERRALEREGYIMGVDDPAPAVVSLNTVVAGLGVTAGLNLFVALTGGTQPLDQLYDATTGAIFTTRPMHQSGCDVCDEAVGLKAQGDSQIVSAYD
jgi:hypothetical protein